MKRDFELADPFLYGLLKSYARENRRNQTDAEEFLWRQLKRNALGVKFKRQLIILNYIADFACLEKSLIIEVDGGYHFRHDQMELDAYRTEELEKIGFKVKLVDCGHDNIKITTTSDISLAENILEKRKK